MPNISQDKKNALEYTLKNQLAILDISVPWGIVYDKYVDRHSQKNCLYGNNRN